MNAHRLRGDLPQHATRRQLDVLAAYVEADIPAAGARISWIEHLFTRPPAT